MSVNVEYCLKEAEQRLAVLKAQFEDEGCDPLSDDFMVSLDDAITPLSALRDLLLNS